MTKPPQRTPRSNAPIPARGNGAVPPPDVERAMVLRDVMDHAVRVQREITDPRPRRKSRAPLIWALVCLPLIAASVYSWVARPEFIWGSRERSVSPQRQEANMRVAMFLLAQRIESYRKIEGAYPSSLDAFGARVEGITYRVASDSAFELRATQEGKPIVFRSRDNVADFLGNSATLIQGRTK